MTKLIVKGCYHDVLTDSRGQMRWDSGWRSNHIVQKCDVLLAALMKRHEGMQGILYLAIGQGETDWDSKHPSPLPANSKLTQEICRQALTSDQIVYLNDVNESITTPSNSLQVNAEFRGKDLVSNGFQPLREFSLFGGDATEELNSGFMINHAIHPRIDLTPEVTLSRKLYLTFAAGALQQEELGGFGAALPVLSIDGVGDKYANYLSEEGINSLGDLVEIDPMRPVGNIPQVKLREFRAKARMVMRLRIVLTPFVPLADRSISSLLSDKPEILAKAIDTPDITPDQVTHLQEELAALQVALDNAQLQRITLGDLVSS